MAEYNSHLHHNIYLLHLLCQGPRLADTREAKPLEVTRVRAEGVTVREAVLGVREAMGRGEVGSYRGADRRHGGGLLREGRWRNPTVELVVV